MGVGGQRQPPATLSPGKAQYPIIKQNIFLTSKEFGNWICFVFATAMLLQDSHNTLTKYSCQRGSDYQTAILYKR
jgi:hypothetical protein